MNFGEGDYVMTNTPATLQEMARQITAMGVRPEIEAFDTRTSLAGEVACRAGPYRGPGDDPIVHGDSVGCAR